MKMNRLPWLTAAVAASTLLLAPMALAHPGEGKGPRQPMPAFEAIDTNKDGALTPAELKAGLAAKPRMLQRAEKIFGRMDTNDDGKVQKAEHDAWKARRAEKRKGGGKHHGGGKPAGGPATR